MSFDRAIDFVCPHIIREEALFLQDDRRTVRPLRPISSIQGVKVRLNRLLEVPALGVQSPATVLASKSEPFTIASGQNTMVVEVNNQSYTLSAEAGNRLSAKEVAFRMASSVPSSVLSTSVTSKGRLNLVTKGKGSSERIIVRSGGLLSVFGYTANQVWRGRDLAPGFFLVNDSSTLNDRPTKLIVFNRQLKGFGDFVEVDYPTVREECRRCGGLGVENDWRYGLDGNLIEVLDEALLLQEVQKFVFTVQGTNPAHRWYGTQVVETLGQKLTSSQIVQNLIVNEIYEGFRRWQSIKSQQELKAGQYVSDKEYPFRLVSVTLEQAEQDPTVVFVNATIQNRSSQPIQIERGIRLPEPLDLLGGTVQEGVIRQSTRRATLVG